MVEHIPKVFIQTLFVASHENGSAHSFHGRRSYVLIIDNYNQEKSYFNVQLVSHMLNKLKPIMDNQQLKSRKSCLQAET